MRPEYKVRQDYIGDGSTSEYSFDFKVVLPAHLLVLHLDDEEGLEWATRGSDTTYFTTTLNPGLGGKITLVTPLELNHKLMILLADDQPTQPAKFVQTDTYRMEKIERALDTLSGQLQRVRYLLDRSIRLPEKQFASVGTELPEIPATGQGVLGYDTNQIKVFEPEEFEGPPGPQGNPWFIGSGDPNSNPPLGPSPNEGDSYINVEDMYVWNYNGTSWDNTGVIFPIGAVDIEGFSLRYQEFVDFDTPQEAFEYIFDLGYMAPQITAFTSVGSTTLREKGDPVVPGELTAQIKKNTNNISSVQFYRAGVLIDTVANPNPSGGTETYNDTTPLSDTTTFRVDVRDVVDSGQGNTLVQRSLTYNYVYPYYGVGAAPGLTAQQASVATGVNKYIENVGSKTKTIAATVGQTIYFGYPSSYGDLANIYDTNGFNVTGSFTKMTGNVTGLDMTQVPYTFYYLTTPLGASGSFEFNFSRT